MSMPAGTPGRASLARAFVRLGRYRQRQRGAQGDCQSSKAFLIRGGHVPKHRLFRPISIAAATWPRVADGFDKTAETASHFVDAFSRSPAQPVNMKANSRATILIGAIYAKSVSLSGFSRDTRRIYAPFFQMPGWKHKRVEYEIARADEIGAANSQKAREAAERRWAKERADKL